MDAALSYVIALFLCQGHSSEAMSSDEYYTSTSDTDPEDPEDGAAAEAELDNLVTQLQELTERNDRQEVTYFPTRLIHRIVVRITLNWFTLLCQVKLDWD